MTPRYLLLIGCSRRKRLSNEPLPAIERYDGVNFRVVRKAKREGYWPQNLELLILSAKYGILESSSLIDEYDLRMTKELALSQRSAVSENLDARLSLFDYNEIFVNLGKTYLLALTQSRALRAVRVSYARGGIGERMSQMRQWIIEISHQSTG